jgi:hypothetical protein
VHGCPHPSSSPLAMVGNGPASISYSPGLPTFAREEPSGLQGAIPRADPEHTLWSVLRYRGQQSPCPRPLGIRGWNSVWGPSMSTLGSVVGAGLSVLWSTLFSWFSKELSSHPLALSGEPEECNPGSPFAIPVEHELCSVWLNGA